jgi:hypothetical protein
MSPLAKPEEVKVKVVEDALPLPFLWVKVGKVAEVKSPAELLPKGFPDITRVIF